MRLVWLQLQGYRRFEDAKINLDAPVIALVGPNEAGKSSLLKALLDVVRPGEFGERNFTRDVGPGNPLLEASFLLDEVDRKVLKEMVPEASKVRWYCIWQDRSGQISSKTIPDIPWPGTAAGLTRKSLAKLQKLKWMDSAPETIVEQVGYVQSLLTDSETSPKFDKGVLEELDDLRTKLLGEAEDSPPATLLRVCEDIANMIADEGRQRPQDAALELLHSRLPEILEFSEGDRTIRTDYELQDSSSWTDGLRNLARLADLDLSELARVSIEGRPELREDLLKDANGHLEDIFANRWSQANLSIHLGVQGTRLEIFVSSDGGRLYRLEDRSDGLRTYLALIAFLDTKEVTTPPILVIDEAESHLHWDAQADLIRVLYEQEIASQVVYSTHSPGCLPHDLGHGIRAIDPTGPDRSTVRNWVWEDDAGFRPLLIHMGASTAALTPHRFAVATEGVADFILLPSLLRAATGEGSLPYQIVPGISQLSREGVRSIDSESDAMVYLTDGDDGGRQLVADLKRAGIPKERLFSLPVGVVLEDLVHEAILTKAIVEELRRSGKQPTHALNLPTKGRSAYLKNWYRQAKVKPPSKRAVASRILELAARHPEGNPQAILADKHRATLVRRHESFLAIFESRDSE